MIGIKIEKGTLPVLPRESQTASARVPAASSEPDDLPEIVPDALTDGHHRRGPTRLRHTRRTTEAAGSEARIEVLGDRIELLEYTLNAYIEKIDAVATHATRISVDRLTPIIEKLGRVLDESRISLSDAAPADGIAGASEATPVETGSQDAAALPAELSAIVSRLEALEVRVAGLPDRIRIAAAPPLQSGNVTARPSSQFFAALTSLSRQQDGLKSHLNNRLDTLETLASQGSLEEISKQLSSCEAHIARLPEKVQNAGSTSMMDPSAVANTLDQLSDTLTALAERQTEAQASLIDRLDTLEARLPKVGGPQSSDRLDALEAKIAALPNRIAVACAPPAIQDAEAQRGGTARVFSALSAFGRQQEDLKSTIERRLGALEKLAMEGTSLPTSTAKAVADQLKSHFRDVTTKTTSSDASAIVRTTSQRDRNLTLALARLERGIAALAAREKSAPDALDAASVQAEARTARILDAIASLKSEMREDHFAAETVVSPQQSAVQTALAELLAMARRNAGQRTT